MWRDWRATGPRSSVVHRSTRNRAARIQRCSVSTRVKVRNETSENASFGASSRPQMMRGFPTMPTSAPPCGRTWSGLWRRCSRTRPLVLRCRRTFRFPAGPGTDCRTPAQVDDLIRSRQVSRLSLPDPARRRALRGLACLRDPAKTEPLVCPRSNDQNLWMVLGAVTRRSAPSRG
jgi:hypothetical protein